MHRHHRLPAAARLSHGGRRRRGSARDGWRPGPRGPGVAPAAGRCLRRPTTSSPAPSAARTTALAGLSRPDAVGHLHARELLAPGAEGLAQLLLRVLRDLLGHVVVHAPGNVRVERHASAMDGPERHAPRRGGGEGEFEQVVAWAVQFQSHHYAARRTWGGRRPFFARFGTYQDHRPLGPCHDGHADVAQEVALDGRQPPRTEHEHLGLRRRLEQCVLGVVGDQVADDGEARVARLELRPRVVHDPLRPVVLVHLRGDAGRFRHQQGPRVQQAQRELAPLGFVGGPVGGGKALG